MTALRKTPIALLSDAAPFVIRAERASDVVVRETLLDACFGENRSLRTCQRLRDGRAPAEGLALSAVAQGRLVGRGVGGGGGGGGGGMIVWSGNWVLKIKAARAKKAPHAVPRAA